MVNRITNQYLKDLFNNILEHNIELKTEEKCLFFTDQTSEIDKSSNKQFCKTLVNNRKLLDRVYDTFVELGQETWKFMEGVKYLSTGSHGKEPREIVWERAFGKTIYEYLYQNNYLWKMIEEAEDLLLGLGLKTCRVRHHGSVARIEIAPEDFDRVMTPANRNLILNQFRDIGFVHVALDLKGYVRGSMNREIKT